MTVVYDRSRLTDAYPLWIWESQTLKIHEVKIQYHCQQTELQEMLKKKKCPSDIRKVEPDGNTDLHKGMMSAGKGNYMGKCIIFFSI